MADLDHFKTVNDRFGHPFGDLVLAVTAQALRGNVRESDVVARYGGEEFLLMLPETPRAEAMIVAEKLRAAIEAQDYTDGIQSTRITLSLGVAALPESAPTDVEDLLRRADDALYAAKHGGRNRAVAAPSAATHEG
jgi:diguanylate cyclase (GGDEF)-like protein